MIFNVPGHIAMIQNGLFYERNRIRYPDMIIKTQTRRLNRGIYKVGKDYAVQRKRGVKAEPGMRILMDRIWEEKCISLGIYVSARFFNYISDKDARAEGGYTPEEFEKIFFQLNPTWNLEKRWAFEFHVIEVYTTDEKETYRKLDAAQKELDKEEEDEQKLEGSLKHLHQEVIEHIHPYVTTKIEKVLK